MMDFTATYRLQFRNGMTFAKAAGLVPYFKKLGISHVYASPIFTATRDSTHGYDVTDPNEIDPAIGGRAGFDSFSAALKQAGLGLILDIVPNHLAASLETPWWRDVIEWGEASRHAHHFDIDWSERLTLPVLGRPFGEACRRGEIRLVLDGEAGVLAFDHQGSHYPLSPASYLDLLMPLGDTLGERIAETALAAPSGSSADFHAAVRHHAGDPAASGLAAALAEVSGDPARMEEIHARQPYRLTYWKDAARHLTYRRFFEVAGLVGVRVEAEPVFEDMHRLIFSLVDAGAVDGLRVDHIDGLADPGTYLSRLRERIGDERLLLVEKILGPEETLPAEWPVDGTTGYEFIAATTPLMLAEGGLVGLERVQESITGSASDPEAELQAIRQRLLDENFRGEMSTLVQLASRVLAAEGQAAAFSPDRLRHGIAAILSAFDVYRTYGHDKGLSAQDQAVLAAACRRASAGGDGDAVALIAFLHRLIAGEVGPEAKATQFRTRFQQLSGPLMAKSVEDTLFYRQNRLLALNEVGMAPDAGPLTVSAFHARMAERARQQPRGLSAASTHDTKRGEDARARIVTLAEDAERWGEGVRRWQAMNAQHAGEAGGLHVPDAALEWLIYQALLGIWPEVSPASDPRQLPALQARFAPYLEKVLREAKLHSSWTHPEPAYEEAALAFVRAILDPANSAFLRDFDATARPYMRAGYRNSLLEAVIRVGAPGVPDLYQGAEGLNFALVDPDNRRMPDYERLAALVESGPEATFGGDPYASGALKLHVLRRGLLFRKLRPALFARGDYRPIDSEGAAGEHAVAFLREDDTDLAIYAGLRQPLRHAAAGGWTEGAARLSIPRAHRHGGQVEAYVDIVTGRTLSPEGACAAERLFATWPVAILVARGDAAG